MNDRELKRYRGQRLDIVQYEQRWYNGQEEPTATTENNSTAWKHDDRSLYPLVRVASRAERLEIMMIYGIVQHF